MLLHVTCACACACCEAHVTCTCTCACACCEATCCEATYVPKCRRCRTLTRLTPIDTSHAYRLSELVLRVSECVEAVSKWCRSVCRLTLVSEVSPGAAAPLAKVTGMIVTVRVRFTAAGGCKAPPSRPRSGNFAGFRGVFS